MAIAQPLPYLPAYYFGCAQQVDGAVTLMPYAVGQADSSELSQSFIPFETR